MSKTTEILELGYQQLKKIGWCQKHFAIDTEGHPHSIYDEDVSAFSAFCSLGSLRMANNRVMGWCDESDPMYINPSWTSARMLLRKAIFGMVEMVEPGIYEGHGGSIGKWNDTNGRTKEEVLAVWKRAIDLSKESN